ncbi:MAG TPA: phosphoesterase, partial [Afipia sp.]
MIEVRVAGVDMTADLSGALFWEDERLLVVSDLHLEKGSSFAARGVLLPPYDTAATLARLGAAIMRHQPRIVIALGDSFHDREAHGRLSAPDRESLSAL